MALEVVKENYSFTNLELKLFGYDMVNFSGFKFDHAVEIELTYGKSGEIVGYTTKNYKRSISAEIYFEELDRLTLLAAPYGGLIEKLPQPYQNIDDDFIARNKDVIDVIKSHFADKGGLHVLDVSEGRKIICRVPNKTQVDETLEKARKEKQTDVAQRLTGQCCLYPSFEVVNGWVQDSPGIFIPISNKLIELIVTTQEVTAKKL